MKCNFEALLFWLKVSGWRKKISKQSKPGQSRDIQVFLGFAKFYKGLIRNFSKIEVPFSSILWITDNHELNIQTSKNELNHNIVVTDGGAGEDHIDSTVNGDIENLWIGKLAKAKKLNLAKCKKSKLAKAK